MAMGAPGTLTPFFHRDLWLDEVSQSVSQGDSGMQ